MRVRDSVACERHRAGLARERRAGVVSRPEQELGRADALMCEAVEMDARDRERGHRCSQSERAR